MDLTSHLEEALKKHERLQPVFFRVFLGFGVLSLLLGFTFTWGSFIKATILDYKVVKAIVVSVATDTDSDVEVQYTCLGTVRSVTLTAQAPISEPLPSHLWIAVNPKTCTATYLGPKEPTTRGLLIFSVIMVGFLILWIGFLYGLFYLFSKMRKLMLNVVQGWK